MAPERGILSPPVSFANSFSPLYPFLFDFLPNLSILFYVVYVSPCFWKSVCYFLYYCEMQSLFTFFTFFTLYISHQISYINLMNFFYTLRTQSRCLYMCLL